MSEVISSNQQLVERFEFWITTHGYNATRELSAFLKGGRRRIYVNPTVELAWQAVEALHGSPVETSGKPLPTVEFMNGYISARTDRSHLLGLLHDWFRHHKCARGPDGRLLHPDLDVETQRELAKLESSEKSTAPLTISKPPQIVTECPKCRTQLAFEGDECGLCKEETT